MNRICQIAFVAAALLMPAMSLWPASPGKELSVKELADTDTVTDNRPLLKRLFKEFPTLYSDTAYTDDRYIIVIRAVLLNNTWHRHHSATKVVPPADSDSVGIAADCHPMVRFKK